MPSYYWRDCQFYEADITVDAILAFPWLQANRIGVFPHLKALATMEPEFSTLLGVTQRSRAVYASPQWGRGYSAYDPTPYDGGGGGQTSTDQQAGYTEVVGLVSDQ